MALVVYLEPQMKTDAPFLTHEEFAKLPTEEKFAYLARALPSTAGEAEPSQPRRKARSARKAPKARRAGLPAQQ